jgi:long-chain fatty acid transport protein
MTKRGTLAAASCGLAGVVLASSPALGAGFALKEQSSSALGNAFAGATAEAGDISYMFFNPAGLTRHSGHRVTGAVSYIAPQSEPEDMQGSTAGILGGAPITGGDGGSDISEDAAIPAFYGLLSFSKRLKFGLGINVPYGLETDYDDGWTGRYHALNSQLQTVNINPNVAYRLTDSFSAGAGFQAHDIYAELPQAVDFASIGADQGISGSMPP